MVVRSLARPNVEKRRSLRWDAPHDTECISKKAAPPVSTITSDKLSEAYFIQRAREGDRAAFEYLYQSHGKRVSAVCFRMLGNTTDAEDLTQEVFLLLFRKIHTFRGESAFSTWLHRLVVNLVLMHLRKKSKVKQPRRASIFPLLICSWRDCLIESISNAASRGCRPAVAQYLSSTTLKDTSITRSHRSWDARKVCQSRR